MARRENPVAYADADHAKRRKAVASFNQQPVHAGVDEVGHHQRVHHRPHDVHGLEVAAQNGVQRVAAASTTATPSGTA